MREILFRGQTQRRGERVRIGDGQKLPSRWVYGGVLQGAGDRSIIYGGLNVNDPAMGLEKWIIYSDTLGQFTGATDKNGKKIFEHDIARFDKGVFVVRYSDCRMGFCFDGLFGRGCQPGFTTPHWEDVEIIGNIHDNPELLEG